MSNEDYIKLTQRFARARSHGYEASELLEPLTSAQRAFVELTVSILLAPVDPNTEEYKGHRDVRFTAPERPSKKVVALTEREYFQSGEIVVGEITNENHSTPGLRKLQ